MGCFRLGCSFLISLFMATVFTVLGAFLGTFLTLALRGNLQSASFASPLDMVQANPTGTFIGGGIGALIGVFLMVSIMRRASDINWLKKHGKRITAVVAKIETRRESRQVAYASGNGTQYRTEWQTYYMVVAHWTHPQTAQTYTFHSDRSAFYPKQYAPGSAISVLIDPQNLRRYLVEV